ncbi:unnamed protein product [Rhodiola kirilowii]
MNYESFQDTTKFQLSRTNLESLKYARTVGIWTGTQCKGTEPGKGQTRVISADLGFRPCSGQNLA